MSWTPTETNQERNQILLMKAVDGELTNQEKLEFEGLLRQQPQLRKELQQYKNLKEVTQNMKFKSPPAEIWDKYWLGIYNRLERGIAWILFSLGVIILLTYGGFKGVEAIIADQNLALIVKVGLVLSIAGVMILLVSVVREKLYTHMRDPYREITI